jgi:hypothetical protein
MRVGKLGAGYRSGCVVKRLDASYLRTEDKTRVRSNRLLEG